MKKNVFFILIIVTGMMYNCKKDTNQRDLSNPFFSEYDTPFDLPPFEKIKPEHFLPAFKEGMLEQNNTIQLIIDNQEKPTFENTIVALDRSDRLLSNVSCMFFLIEGAESTSELQAVNEEISPVLSEHQDNIYLNEALFDKVKAVYDSRMEDSLNIAQIRLLDKQYKAFIRSGILLSEEKKKRLRDINKSIADLYVKFGNNLLKETNDFNLIIENENELAGLPEWAKSAASDLPESNSLSGKWVFNLQRSSFTPLLQYADNRTLREKIYKAYINRGSNGNEYDNTTIVASIVKLRDEKAKLLEYDYFSNYKLERMMAKNAAAVYSLLNEIHKYAQLQARTELTELQSIANKNNLNSKIEAWDWFYYAEKLRKEKYDLDEEELKPYFQLENVLNGAFETANKLFGISFSLLENVPVYHPDVTVYEVKDADGSHLGVFYTDYFTRPGKRAGAWMANIREQYVDNFEDIRPVVYNVANFTKPTGGMPSLLSLDEARTLFHEFGHALHGLLSRCSYTGISGTNVAMDFVELPSQLMECWAVHPEVLKIYAKHYKTGETIPDELIEKLQSAALFNQGFITGELVAAALLDMDWHTTDLPENIQVDEFEKTVKKNLGMIPEIDFRYQSTNFNHIFSTDEYAAGYYSYLWSEVLVADAYQQFEKNGIFDRMTATAYRQTILERGDSNDPMELFVQFKGTTPDFENFLKRRGLK